MSQANRDQIQKLLDKAWHTALQMWADALVKSTKPAEWTMSPVDDPANFQPPEQEPKKINFREFL